MRHTPIDPGKPASGKSLAAAPDHGERCLALSQLPDVPPPGRSDTTSGVSLSSLPPLTHCNEKGCVFPVERSGERRCAAHAREQHEPEHFASFQPTILILEQAKYGLPDPDSEPDISRAQDRIRRKAERQDFLEEAA